MSVKESASQEFLDSQQYTTNSVLRYERIFGKYFVSTGGPQTTKKFVDNLNLKPGQKVLDVGCGIGGSAFYMAHNFRVSVHGVDLSKNMVTLAQYNGATQKFPENVSVTFEIADATKMECEPGSFDVIYSRDSILHIFDKPALFKQFYKWLKPGGKLFITDYCCGAKPHSEAFRKYVAQRGYHLLTTPEYGQTIANAGFENVSAKDETQYFITILRSEMAKFQRPENKRKFVRDFDQEDYHHIIDGWQDKVIRCGQGDQRWGSFFAIKPRAPEVKKESASQDFLDAQQYTTNSVLRYERIFGKYFVSTGGPQTTHKFVDMLNLKPGMRALDVGCGIGGSAFYMAHNYRVSVLGIDLSKNMVKLANYNGATQKFPDSVSVEFEIADATKCEYEPNSFDLIYSRDAILHIYDKAALFKNFFKWLKPGGKLFITDYCCGPQPHSEVFKSYVRQRGYHLHTPKEYGQLVQKAGFDGVVARDETNYFVQILNDELERFETESEKSNFLRDFKEEDYHHIIEGWKEKVVRCSQGDQRWGSFYAIKSKSNL